MIRIRKNWTIGKSRKYLDFKLEIKGEIEDNIIGTINREITDRDMIDRIRELITRDRVTTDQGMTWITSLLQLTTSWLLRKPPTTGLRAILSKLATCP